MPEVLFSQVNLLSTMPLQSEVLVDYLPHEGQKVFDIVQNRLLEASVVRALQSDYPYNSDNPDSLPWAEPVRLARRTDKIAKWRGFLVGALASENEFGRFVAPDSTRNLEPIEARYQVRKAFTDYVGLIFVARGIVDWRAGPIAERHMSAALLERDPNYGWPAWSQLNQQYLKRKIAFADEYLPEST